jgi:hypothetical protein
VVNVTDAAVQTFDQSSVVVDYDDGSDQLASTEHL